MSRFIAPAFVLLLVVLAVLSLRGGRETPSSAAAEELTARYTLRGAQWQRFGPQGQLEFEGHAETIDYFDDESARLSQFEVAMPNGEGRPWTARSPEGRVPAGDRRLRLLGGVVGEGRWPDGETLQFTTPELWVDSANKRLDTESEVALKSRSREASSRGLKVDGAKQQLTLLHDVRMSYAKP